MPDHKPKPSFSDNLANLVSDIVGDARSKLIDEAWFGRQTTSELPNYYEGLWARYGKPNEPIPDEKSHEQDHTVER